MTPIALSYSDIGTLLSMDSGPGEVRTPCQTLRVNAGCEHLVVEGESISREVLGSARSDRVLYTISGGRLEKLQIFQGHLYKLAPSGGYPALEIDGVRMHRTKGMLPEEEARVKVDCLHIREGQAVLDICTGLGYSSQEAARRGASVLTIERNSPVIALARHNPCSRNFFDYVGSGKIDIVVGDASLLLGTLPGNRFDRIIHDPPSFSLAGELYSKSFYIQLRRLIRDDGLLLHYTGQPGSRYRRLDLKKSVSGRLREAGFTSRWIEKARAVLSKPGN